MPDSIAKEPIPALPHILIDPVRGHALLGARCSACNAVVEGERLACPACGARHSLQPVRLAKAGRIAAHTVVHRSFPGVKTPFVALVVDLDGGGTVRGTLIGVDALAPLPAEQRVTTVFRETGQFDACGRPFLCYYFTPERQAAA